MALRSSDQLPEASAVSGTAAPDTLGAAHLTLAPPIDLGAVAPGYQRYVKPIIDTALALTALLVLAPVLVVVALIVRIDLGPGVFFRQRRVGLRGREFTVLKFRTMLDEAPAGSRQGPCPEHGHKCPQDPRPTGRGGLPRSRRR